jgi:tripartite-type tricarboxylate transporter receptor subunit TctC
MIHAAISRPRACSSPDRWYCVHPSVPAKSVWELIALARQHPGKLTAGINEFGSKGHPAAEMLNHLAGTNTTIVSYKGGGPALMGLLTGDVALLFVVAPVAMSQLEARRVRGLAVTKPHRAMAFPGLPALKEIVPGLEMDVRYAVFFPRATPDAMVTRFNVEMAKALGSEVVNGY